MRWKPGIVYAIPLSDGSYGVAQAGGAMGEFANVIYVALFSYRTANIPTTIELERESAVSLATTLRQSLNRGDWLSVGSHHEVFPKSDFPFEQLAASGYMGAKTFGASILADFLSAFHGLVPWNVMHDPGLYDGLLLEGLQRPSRAVMLDQPSRIAYRENVLGVVA